MVSKEQGRLEPGVRGTSRAAWGARAGAGGWAGRAGVGARRRGRQGGQGARSSPSCPLHASFIYPLRAHLPPRCRLAGCSAGVPAALAARQWDAGAVPSVPVSARTGPVPCCHPALFCRLHGPQLSKPRCQTPGPCPSCWEQGPGGGPLARGGLQTHSRFIPGSRRGDPSLPSWGRQDSGGWRGCKGGQGSAGCPPHPLCPEQPCPAGRSEMDGFLLAMSQCPHHVPSFQGRWLRCLLVWEGVGGTP